jgi:hypothetical protein
VGFQHPHRQKRDPSLIPILRTLHQSIQTHNRKELIYAQYGDLLYGIPNVLLAAEMVLFSLLFWYAYSAGEYSANASAASKSYSQPLNFFRAIFDALNPSDLILGILRAFTLFGSVRSDGSRTNSWEGQGGFGQAGGSYEPIGGRRGRSHQSVNDEGYDMQTFHGPPPMYPEEGYDPTKDRLVGDPRYGRTPSPRQY